MILLFAFILIVDQVTKSWVVQHLNEGDCLYVWSFFNVVRVHNCGVTFGMFKEIAQPIILVIISLIVVSCFVLYAKQNKQYRYPAVAVIAGAIGNVIDRFRYFSVVDFLDFHINEYHWPAFNIADSAIVIGVCCIILISYIKGENHV